MGIIERFNSNLHQRTAHFISLTIQNPLNFDYISKAFYTVKGESTPGLLFFWVMHSDISQSEGLCMQLIPLVISVAVLT